MQDLQALRNENSNLLEKYSEIQKRYNDLHSEFQLKVKQIEENFESKVERQEKDNKM